MRMPALYIFFVFSCTKNNKKMLQKGSGKKILCNQRANFFRCFVYIFRLRVKEDFFFFSLTSFSELFLFSFFGFCFFLCLTHGKKNIKKLVSGGKPNQNKNIKK